MNCAILRTSLEKLIEKKTKEINAIPEDDDACVCLVWSSF